MALAPGARLGPYEIVSALGAGGMGEVYRAKDARLSRDVAIKVLPESLANDLDRRARFEREAKAVAALSHPNIINIHDTGLHEDHPFVVMELLDGETLRDRLANGALPVRKAVEIAVQIARGLGAAHDKQIVHRDLKPENIFIVRDGQVKILDFGLARDIDTRVSGATETRAGITDAGIAMGTVGYMAPEQIRAQAVDGRTDLFAFGAVLFEMLSGTRAFQRDTSADTMTAILKEDPPDLLSANAHIPPSLDRIVRHCLEKHAAERFQSARDVAFALDSLSGTNVGSAANAAVTPASRPHRRWPRAVLVGAGAIVLVAAAVLLTRALVPPASSPTFEAKTWDEEWITNARFGPDGQTIVFSSARVGNVPRLYVIRAGGELYQAMAVNVAGPPVVRPVVATPGAMFVQDLTRGGRLLTLSDETRSIARVLVPGESTERDAPWLDFSSNPYLSGDGKWLAFGDGNQSAGLNYQVALRELATGRVVRLGEGHVTGISPDGRWVSSIVPSTLQVAVYATGAGDAVKLGAGLAGFKGWPGEVSWSPDSRRVTYCGSETGKPPRCYAQDVPSGSPKPVTADGFVRAIGSEDGRSMLLIATDGKGYLAVEGGEPVPVKGLQPEDRPLGVARDGALVVQAGHEVPARIERLNLTTGTRTPVKRVAPPNTSGVNSVRVRQWIDDGKGYAYDYTRELSRMYVVSGVR